MIDSHCHLTYEALSEQLDAVLKRARAAGVERMVTIATRAYEAEKAIALCRANAQVRCAIGIHPHYAAAATSEDIGLIGGMQHAREVVALGEMGLDYHYDYSPRDRQRQVFAGQLELAKELGRPVVIHCREAVDDTLAVMKDFADVPAVFHCFTGTADEARKILDRGYLLGFTGVVTYKRSDELREVAKFTPADRLLVETDAPYLSPEPVRKQRTNEPAFVMHTAAVVAHLRGMTLMELDELTTANTLRFFRWT